MDEFILFIGGIVELPEEVVAALFVINPYLADPPTEEGEALFV